MNELSQLDGLIESDILEALGQSDTKDENDEAVTLEDFNEEITLEDIPADNLNDTEDDPSDVFSETENCISESLDEKKIQQDININTSDLATLLSELLNHKTIEITIKIKD